MSPYFRTKIIYAFLLSMNAACPVYILINIIIVFYLKKSICCEYPDNATSSNSLSLHASAVQIFTSAPCSQIPSIYVLSVRNHFSAHTKLQEKYVSTPLSVLIYSQSNC
jgi:hypothetical protein